MGRSVEAARGVRLTDGQAGLPNGWRAAALLAVVGLSAAAGAQSAARNDDLPDAPSVQMQDAASGDAEAQTAGGSKTPALKPCKDVDQAPAVPVKAVRLSGPPPCLPENPISPIVTSVNVRPLTSKQKGVLAFREFVDPFNLMTIAGYSGVAVAENSHTAYGSGFGGWGKLTGYGMVEAGQAEFFGTYAIPSLVHQDPRYHRLPRASMKRRFWHAVEHTYVSRHDDGRPMPNYATLLTIPISAELSNLYVPGIETDGRSTAKRVVIGIAADPAGTIVAEFLPDVAKHIHIHVQFVQELVERAMVGSPTTTTQ